MRRQAVDLPSCLQAARKGLGFLRGSCTLPARQPHSLCLRVAAQQRSGNWQSAACMLGRGAVLVRNNLVLDDSTCLSSTPESFYALPQLL